MFKGTLKSDMHKERCNRNVERTCKSKLKSHFEIEIKKEFENRNLKMNLKIIYLKQIYNRIFKMFLVARSRMSFLSLISRISLKRASPSVRSSGSTKTY